MAKKRKIVVNDFFNGNANEVVKVNAILKQKELPLLESRCLLANFTKRIENWQINEREWGLLRRTPFGRLIKDILGLQMNDEIVDALLGFWNEEHCGFLVGGIMVPFTADDIALITGLPNRGQKVVKQRKCLNHDTQFSWMYLSMKFIERRIDGIIRNRDDPYPEADKFFVQQMILYFWVFVLFPRSNRSVSKFMASYVKNLNSIGTYNWAEVLHSFLVKEINAKSMVVKERNLGKDVVPGIINGLCFIINAWFFEHVDFGKDSRPSNPNARPRMLKWAKGCKMWRRKPFLQRFRALVEDNVCYRLLPEVEEFELMSLHSVEHIPSHIGGCDGPMGVDPSSVSNLESVGSEIKTGCQEMRQRAMEGEKEKQATKVEKDYVSDINNLKQLFLEQHARISVLERKVENLQVLVHQREKMKQRG